MNNERGDITDTLNKCCRNLLSKIGLWSILAHPINLGD